MKNESSDYAANNKSSTELSLSAYMEWWRNHLKIITICTVMCLIGGIAVLLYLPQSNTLTSQFTLKYTDRGLPMGADIATLMNFSEIKMNTSFENEMEYINSNRLLGEVINSLHLQYRYYEKSGIGRANDLYRKSPIKVTLLEAENYDVETASIKIRLVTPNQFFITELRTNDNRIKTETIKATAGVPFSTPIGRIIIDTTDFMKNYIGKTIDVAYMSTLLTVNELRKRLSYTMTDKYSTVLEFTFTDESKQRAEDFLNTLPIIYNRHWREELNTSARKAMPILAKRMEKVEGDMLAAEMKIANFMQQNKIISVDTDNKEALKEILKYEQAAFELETQLKATAEILSKSNGKNIQPISIPGGMTNRFLLKMIDSYNRQLFEYKRLKRISGNSNPEVKELYQLLSEQKKNITTSVNRQKANITAELNNLQAKLKQLKSKIPESNRNELVLTELTRLQQAKEQEYLEILKKRETLLMVINTDADIVRIIAHANEEKSKDFPIPLLLVLCILVGMFGIPMAFYIIQNTFDKTVKSKQDFKNCLLQPIAVIPQADKPTTIEAIRNMLHITPKKASRPKIVAGLNTEKIIPVNESFRSLCTSVNFMTRGKTETILVTSFAPRSGKTFFCLNLGVSLALGKKKVLLIDLDLRYGTLSKIVNSPAIGISEYLNNRNETDDIIYQIPGIKNLDIIVAGFTPPNPTELLESNRLETLIGLMRKHYDIIIIDSTPINIISDTKQIARIADRTFFIARANLFEKSQVAELEELYTSKALPNLSIILNGTDRPHINMFLKR